MILTRIIPHGRWSRGILALLVWTAASVDLQAADCPGGDLIRRADVRALGASGDPRRVVDGRFAEEGSTAGPGSAVMTTAGEAFLFADLGSRVTINAFVLQAGQNDFYSVEGSVDGLRWFGFWRASPVGRGGGLRTRAVPLPRPGEARFLRVRGEGGDNSYAVSEFRAYCRLPEPWPPDVDTPKTTAPWIGTTGLTVVKALVALSGMVLFLLPMRRSEPGSTRRRRFLLALGVLGGLCWWNLGTFNEGRYLHDWEHYHYYLGSKYFEELAYTRLYACTVLADVEAGLESAVAERKVRNLETNRIESTASVLADPDRCRSHFTPERWESFRSDVAWFRGQVSPWYWSRAQLDHGYNATPLWTAVGGALSNLAPPASRATITALALIDPLLLLAMWVVVFRTFGPRATAAALIWWGTNQAADFSWIGGAFLRQDWLVLSVMGLCAVRSGRAAVGGFALCWATLSRIFPGFLVAAMVLQVLARSARERRWAISKTERRFALGCLAALAVLGTVSLGAGGVGGWRAFAANTRVHMSSHGTNTMGLPPLLAYEHASRLEAVGDPALVDPFRDWNAARDRVLRQRRLAGITVLVGFVALLTWSLRGKPPWVALVLGIGLIPFTTAQSCYYYSILLAYGLLVGTRGESRSDVIAGLLCALAAISQLFAATFGSPAVMDQRFTLLSVVLVLFVTCATWIAGRQHHS